MSQDECIAVANLAGIHDPGRSPNAGFEHAGVTDKAAGMIREEG
jgi:hypothetical protein